VVGTQFVKVMRNQPERKSVAEKIGRAASAVLIVSTLAALVGCAGVSQSGSGHASGKLLLGSTNLNFGNVTPNTTKTLTVTASNAGTQSINISSVSFSTRYFGMTSTSLPLSLAAGQSITLGISFTPNAASNFAATLSIGSDASDGTQTVALSGAGASASQLQINPTTEPFGSVNVGSSKPQVVTINNATSSSISISQITVAGTGFSLSGITTPVTLAASQTTTFTITFSPKASGNAAGSAMISSDAANPSITIPLSGMGVAPGALSANPTSLSFGNVNVGNTGSLSETIKNPGGSSVSVTQVGVTGTGFSVSGITTPVTLNGGQSATFTVSFAPPAAGSVNGTLTVTSTATNPVLTVPVSGTGVATTVGQLSVSPATLALGNVTVGSSGTASGAVSASGASVTVTAASTNNSVFTIGGFSLPHTIGAGQSAPFTITFSPAVSGSAAASLTFTSNAQPSTTTEALTGTGVAAATHSVSLSWNASTSSNISGYNVYRTAYTSSCGSFAKINSLLDTGTLYTDSSVKNATSYCYATTAVDTSNVESGYSNIVSNVQIPVQ